MKKGELKKCSKSNNFCQHSILEVYTLNVLKTTQRDYGIDLLRIVSMLMVPIVHILGQGGVISATIPFSLQYESAWLLESFLLVAVNCFVLITGYVYYGKETKYYRLSLKCKNTTTSASCG